MFFSTYILLFALFISVKFEKVYFSRQVPNFVPSRSFYQYVSEKPLNPVFDRWPKSTVIVKDFRPAKVEAIPKYGHRKKKSAMAESESSAYGPTLFEPISFYAKISLILHALN